MKANKTGIARIFAAFSYSADGIRSAFRHEAAFRQESLLYLLLLVLLYLLPLTLMFKCLLLTVNTLVLVVELLNSAIESVVDLVAPEYNIYAKKAKDMGSAAVLFALLLALVLWLAAFADTFFPLVNLGPNPFFPQRRQTYLADLNGIEPFFLDQQVLPLPSKSPSHNNCRTVDICLDELLPCLHDIAMDSAAARSCPPCK